VTSATAGYEASGDRLFYFNTHVRGAEPRTFEVLAHDWARDASSVFCRARRLKQADRATFQVVNTLYAKDASRAYAVSGEIAGADAASFEAFGTGEWELDWGPPPRHFHQGYAADARSVWHHLATIGKAKRLPKVDRATFRWLKWGFARDGEHAYSEGQRLQRCDARSFLQLSPYFSRDDTHVFFLSREVLGADPASFVPMGRGHTARDERHVYDRFQIIDGADPTTYVPLGEGDMVGRDDAHVFCQGKIVPGVDHATFEHVRGTWFRDATIIYKWTDPIAQIDASTFRATSDLEGEDRNGRWRGSFRLKD
jgi:hypothetical protein